MKREGETRRENERRRETETETEIVKVENLMRRETKERMREIEKDWKEN